jgi:hypothetical protein
VVVPVIVPESTNINKSIVKKKNKTNSVTGAETNTKPATNTESATCTFKCLTCYMIYKTSTSLQRHQSRCKNILNSLQCCVCKKYYSSSSSLSHHRRKCKEEEAVKSNVQNTTSTINASTTSTINASTTSTINASTTSIINASATGSNITVLELPDSINDEAFEFKKDHITSQHIETMFGTRSKFEIGLTLYARDILKRQENRVVYKSNPNIKYCKVLRNGTWEYALDKDALYILSFYMSCAAYRDVSDYVEKYKSQKKGIKINAKTVLEYLTDINEESDRNHNFKTFIERLRLVVINISELK